MREIKFRAWSTFHGKKKMVYLGNKFTSEDMKEESNWKIMQYTGLKDKNGVDIYEGDIVRTRFRGVQQIYFGCGGEGEPADFVGDYHGWCVGNNDGLDECTGFLGPDVEVIGNIYEKEKEG